MSSKSIAGSTVLFACFYLHALFSEILTINNSSMFLLLENGLFFYFKWIYGLKTVSYLVEEAKYPLPGQQPVFLLRKRTHSYSMPTSQRTFCCPVLFPTGRASWFRSDGKSQINNLLARHLVERIFCLSD